MGDKPTYEELEQKVRILTHRLEYAGNRPGDEALRESEELFRTVVRLSPDAIVVADPSGLLTYASPKSLQMFGHSSDDEVLGRNILCWVAPEEQQKVSTIMFRLLRDGTLRASEFTLIKKDGTRFIGEVTAAVINSHDRAPARMFAIIRDVTERKQAEGERRLLEERLLQAEKMEALGTLAGGVAHDLNNVLGIVVGYSELLQHELNEHGSAGSKVTEILKGGQKAAAIVQDLLTLARRGVRNRKVLNLNDVVLECLNSPEFDKIMSYHPNIRIGTDLEACLLNVSGSAVHLEKSLLNLLSNAAEAMREGGVILIRTGNQYLDKPVSGYDEMREGDYVVMTLSDTGEGIPSGDLKRIFEPFYTKKVMGRSGTGLGLAVVWGTVKDHMGYINVESKEGKGTTFTVYLPATREEITRAQVSICSAEYMGKGESILVVDDVKEQRELAATMLKMLKYSVVHACSGEEAVEYLRHNAVNLVVLDMIMEPGMDGLDTYIKILETHPYQRAVIVSGFSETERVSKAQALGAGAYVKKPYMLETLGLAVKNELGRTS
jgi:PAS domain S-box-containing protein